MCSGDADTEEMTVLKVEDSVSDDEETSDSVAEEAIDDVVDNTVDMLSFKVSAKVDIAARPSSCFTSTSSAIRLTCGVDDAGRNRVQKSATRRPLSTIRCLMMNSTTRTKNVRPAKIKRRSIQSAFSSAVMSCLDVRVIVERTSCCVEVDFRVAVDFSAGVMRMLYEAVQRCSCVF